MPTKAVQPADGKLTLVDRTRSPNVIIGEATFTAAQVSVNGLEARVANITIVSKAVAKTIDITSVCQYGPLVVEGGYNVSSGTTRIGDRLVINPFSIFFDGRNIVTLGDVSYTEEDEKKAAVADELIERNERSEGPAPAKAPSWDPEDYDKKGGNRKPSR